MILKLIDLNFLLFWGYFGSAALKDPHHRR